MSINDNSIPLFWWSEVRFSHKSKENYGDLLSKYLVEKVSKKGVKWVHPKKQPWYKRSKKHFIAIGSILHHASKQSIVWGGGIIDKEHPIAHATFTAVRGPQTRDYLQELGYSCPAIYGDPAILLPLYYKPEVKKAFKLGIIPHYKDYEQVSRKYLGNEDIKVINLMTMDVEQVTAEIMACERTISSSLHGLIVSHAYSIPSLWVKFSDKIFGDGVKYLDYLDSLELRNYEPEFLTSTLSADELNNLFREYPTLPDEGKMGLLRKGLLSACPFL